MAARTTWPTPADALDRQPAALDGTMLAQRLQRVLRTGGQITATGRQQRADGILIKPHQQNQQAGEHFFAAFSSALRKSSLCAPRGPFLSGVICGRTTRSSAGRFSAICLKASRIRRLIRLRSTACGNRRLDTIIPSRASPSSLGLAKTWKYAVRTAQRCVNTASYSAAFNKRWRRENPCPPDKAET